MVATITETRVHNMDPDEARQRIEQLVADFTREHPKAIGEVRWSSDGTSAKATGRGFKGTFEVDDREVRIRIDLSLLASALKGRIQDGLASRLDRSFS